MTVVTLPEPAAVPETSVAGELIASGIALTAGPQQHALPLSDGHVAVLLAELAARSPTAIVFVAQRDRRARRIALALSDLDPGLEVLALPAWDCWPGDRVGPSRTTVGHRARALATLARDPARAGRIVVLSADASLQRLPPPATWQSAVRRLKAGASFDVDDWRDYARHAGYLVDNRIDEPGEIAIRGATIEIFPADSDGPVRLETEDGRITSLRYFDPVTQRSNAPTDELVVGPAAELWLDDAARERLHARLSAMGVTTETLDEALTTGRGQRLLSTLFPVACDETATLFDYLPAASVVLDAGVEARQRERAASIRESLDALESLPAQSGAPDPLDLLYRLAQPKLELDLDEWKAGLTSRAVLQLEDAGQAPALPTLPRGYRPLLRHALEQTVQGARVLIAVQAASELERVFEAARDLETPNVQLVERWADIRNLPAGSLAAMRLRLRDGFAHGSVQVLPLVRSGTGRTAAATVRPPIVSAELGEGDYAVHLDHGRGRVEGIETVEQGDAREDVLALTYANDAGLLVPVAELDRVWRYGSADADVRLDSLTAKSWDRSRAEAEIAKVAKALIRDARRRRKTEAPVIELPAAKMNAFVRRFPYEETEGQARAIAAVLADLAAGFPMDRLVIGDVGFGKTEVALRAAAAVALSGQQVALLAPTTVLVRQHLELFERRFKGFDVRVAALIGKMPAREATEVKAGLADGSIQVVIGTHALCSSTLRFADLALVIVDEEQRFGTRHKRALTSLRRGRHALAMSATPIPRTLQTALTGLRDLSVIDTPPYRRRPVRTIVAPHDPALAADALRRERARGGQSFCIVPRIADLDDAASEVRKLLPGARVLIAHGKLRLRELDDAVLAFADGRADVLVSTAIVESGIDIPRANTMLIRRPDLFGLAQLHQLRGRVGRGAAQAFALLLIDPEHPLPEQTARRLSSMAAIESLGGGFAISMLDLDLRGAGDLVGADQTGHLREIGVELYQHLLAEALETARGKARASWTPAVKLGVPQTIPAEYIPEPELRIGLHRRIARSRDSAELEALEDEIRDRFGPLPDEVSMLLATAAIRHRCRTLGIEALTAGSKGIALSFAEGSDDQVRARADQLETAEVDKNGRLVVRIESADASKLLKNTKVVLTRIAR